MIRSWMGAGPALALALTAAAAPAAAQVQPEGEAPSPRLVVTIVVDQFGSDLFNQYRAAFAGGLGVLAGEGVVYPNGFQTHGMTETCPGHSTVLTGVHPNRTGIAANDWIDRATGAEIYCLAAPANRLAQGGEGENGPVGPDNLRASGLGDWIKAAHPDGRVFAVSGKDRGAINLAGSHADGTFWWADGFGFTTYLRPGEAAADRLRPVAGLNAGIRARMEARPDLWAPLEGRCAAMAGDWTIAGGVFHSTVPPRRLAVDTSPVLDELTVEAALTLLREQRLGFGPGLDLLGISLSGTDRIGHRFGSQGPEMCQQILRLDAALGRLMAALKEIPGTLVVLTADHGGSDFAERLAARGYPDAGRMDPGLIDRLNGAVRARFGLGFDPLKADGANIYVVGDGAALPEPRRAEIAAAVAALLREEPGVAAAFTIDELLATPSAARDIHPDLVGLRERIALSTVPARSADVIFALRPGMSPFPGAVGGYLAGHGTPWDHDRRVPIIFWTPGQTGQERTLPVRTVDIAPTLANAAGLPVPADLDGRCLGLAPPARGCPAVEGSAAR
ncbi:alkaline phosphatase family protein [uncultured Brevundimonas sp.]|uniref:alkaline phosphatase family protein n=1 Tax=uncultured Brevundimonas sp. TaxID=213418 RepID=UPI0026171F0C|nr:alkaline phosphatase family protein [uncultured Brevundimonas sp.]